MPNKILRSSLFALLCFAAPFTAVAQLQIQFDYSYDSSNFFSDPIRKGVLEAAASVFETRLTKETFAAITPEGSNTFALLVVDPSSEASHLIVNPILVANTLTIYVGAASSNHTWAGWSTGPSWTVDGSQSFKDLVNSRDTTGNYDPFAGTICFDSPGNWYFDPDATTLEAFPGQYDFFSVAVHEIGHVLGFAFDVAAFQTHISDTTFTGVAAEALYGGPVPLSDPFDTSHWEPGLMWDGSEVSMDPGISANMRKSFTELDFAALQDIGYTVDAIPEPSVAAMMGLGLLGLSIPAILRRRAKAGPHCH